MLPPRSVTLYLDEANSLQHAVRSVADIGDYLGSMRVLQTRTGKPPRAVLDNFTPVFISSAAGTLTVAPVSGVPHHQDAAYLPVEVSQAESTLFLRRGDHYVLRAGPQHDQQQAFLFVTYDINPKILLSPRPIVMRNPVDNPIADHDATSLLRIVQTRELAPVEQFFAAFTMPHVWTKHGGGAVPVITKPTVADVQLCEQFARNFTRAEDRMRSLSEAWPDWQTSAIANSIEDGFEIDDAPARPRMRM